MVAKGRKPCGSHGESLLGLKLTCRLQPAPTIEVPPHELLEVQEAEERMMEACACSA